MTLRQADVEKYVEDNHRITRLPKKLTARTTRCIDGRLEELHTGGVAVTYPGGTFGAAATLIAAVNKYVRKPLVKSKKPKDKQRLAALEKGMSFGDMVAFIEEHFEGVSCHTDTHDHGKKAKFACAGCAHGTFILTDPAYDLGPYRKPFRAYAKELKVRHERGDTSVIRPTLNGGHTEKVVLRVKTNDRRKVIVLSPNDGITSVFLINEGTALELLRQVTIAFYQRFEGVFKRVGKTHHEFSSFVQVMYFQHVRLSVSRLAPDLDVYDVEWSNGGVNKVLVRPSRLQF